MLHHELQSLKAEQGAPSKPATSPVPSSDPFIPGVSQTVSQPYRPKPAPRLRVPPPASTRELQPAVIDESPELTDNFRSTDIASLIHERVSSQAHHSKQFHSRDTPFTQCLPSYQFETPARAHERIKPARPDRRQEYDQPSFSRERTYRGPAPTIPFLTSPDPGEFSRLRISLENILPEDATEHFKYQILTDHLKLEEALLVSDSYSNRLPFTYTMRALTKMYGQPHQLALQRIADLMDGPNIHSGDVKAFCLFGLHVRSLVSMLEQLGQKGTTELECGSHVSRLMSKLPHDLRSS